MSTCALCKELISSSIDGTLSPEEATLLRAHLATCASCRQLLQEYRRIGVAIRSMPVIHPPADLTDSICAQTIDSEPRRLVLLTNRLGYSLAAVAAVVAVFIMAGYLLFGGYQRGIQPEIIASHPEQNHQNWPTYEPIEITFNKEMDRASVEAALVIQPASENQRLAMSWNGNTLQLGASQGLKSATTYVIKVTNTAEDKWGNNLKAGYTLTFSTNSTISQELATPQATPTRANTPTPQPTRIPPTQTAVAVVPDVPTATTEPVVPPAPPVIVPTRAASDDSGNGNDVPTPTATPTRDQTDVGIVPTATPTPRPPTPTATSVPPTATATTPPQPTATSVPPTATVSPTPDTVPVTGAFGTVYWSNDSVRLRLGAATGSAYTTGASELDFQDGSMLYRSDISMIYVLVNNELSWTSYISATSGYPEAELQSDGTWLPGGMFGALWQQHPELPTTLHNALSGSETTFDAGVQQFENGTMLSTSSSVYIFYADGTWEFWPNNG